MSARRPSRSGIRDASKAICRDAILEAAEAVFDERGLHSARIQDIAERAGVAVGTVYNHFEQKEDLARALMARHLPAMAATLAPSPSDPADWTGAFRARLGRMYAYVEAHRHFFRMACALGLHTATGVMPGSTPHPGPLVERMVADGVAAGVLVGDPVRLTRFLLGATRCLVEGALAQGSERVRDEAALAVDLFLRAASPTTPRDESAQLRSQGE
jgi:AcrR family transcriptional regulator